MEDFAEEEITLEQTTEAQMWAQQVDKGSKGEGQVIPGMQNNVKKELKFIEHLLGARYCFVCINWFNILILPYEVIQLLLLQFLRRGNWQRG